MLNRRRLLFAGVAALPGAASATPAVAQKPRPKPKPKWRWKTVTRTFTSNQLITILDEGTATPYPATIRVSGMRQGQIRKVTVKLIGLTHSWPNDLDVMLAGKKGRGVILMNDASGNGDTEPVTNINLTFDDAARTTLPVPLVSGTFRPTSTSDVDPFPLPAPQGITGTALSVFKNANPNGFWSLYVFDDSSGDAGSIAGWSLTIKVRIRVRAKH